MLQLGTLAFASPWLLAALAVLPVLWWLLRVTPPAPREMTFPPVRLLAELIPKEETPARTPPWLLALRLFTAALLIVALAQPMLNPGAQLSGSGPLVLVIDDGWTAARSWSQRLDALADLIDRAEREHRAVQLITAAPPASGEAIRPGNVLPAARARETAAALKPKPWAVDRPALMAALRESRPAEGAEIVWLTDGIDDGQAYSLAELLLGFGSLTVIESPRPELARAVLPPTLDARGLTATVVRPASAAPASLLLRATADDGRILAREPVAFAADAARADVVLELPPELRNRIARIELESEPAAGAVVLLDERWRRRPVGISSGAALEARQPLLSDLYYVERALLPFAEVRTGRVADLLQRELAVLILSDIGHIVGPERTAIERWLDGGGVLVRFAGPRLAESVDNLTPVRVRSGSRLLGGAMSWTEPASLAAFPESSPFANLTVPPDVTVSRQVLAEPDLALSDKTWARLADGTPLVTAEKRGKGWLVLVHTTANTQWSNLALSGLFVDMLRRLVDLSQGIAGAEGNEVLPPLSLLDGFGRPGPAPAAATGVAADAFATTPPSPRHPPGYYGREDQRRALNATTGMLGLAAVERWPQDASIRALTSESETALMPWLLAAALALMLADFLIALMLRGLIGRWRAPATAALLAGLVLAGLSVPDGLAQERRTANPDDFAYTASLDLRLAFVVTGNHEVDNLSRAGLIGLTDALFRRTSVEAAEPLGVNLETDEIAFFPFLYWPMADGQRELSEKALARVDAFMKTGGLILFDTRDHGQGGGFGPNRVGPGTQQLRRLLARLDLPPLIPTPADHVLTKAFYLMQEFPGRYTGGAVWVERHPGGSNDGVSALVIGSHDWAAAWAIDDLGQPLAAVVPGGAQQREHAYRFGINVVMYTLTGNYKADQVHIPALLERLGQ